jgi:hypothetical protein
MPFTALFIGSNDIITNDVVKTQCEDHQNGENSVNIDNELSDNDANDAPNYEHYNQQALIHLLHNISTLNAAAIRIFDNIYNETKRIEDRRKALEEKCKALVTLTLSMVKDSARVHLGLLLF